MPNQPATPNRNVRIDDERWAFVQQVADDVGDGATNSDVVRLAIDRLARDYPAVVEQLRRRLQGSS